MIRARALLSAALLALGLSAAFVSYSTAAGDRPTDGLYAPKASGNLPYSNGAVNLNVGSGGRKIKFPSGVACYTGATPPAGVPANDEVSIHIPGTLMIAAGGKFSFSGPVTLTPEEAQSEEPISTTYKIAGRFVKGKHGVYKAVGTDSSPICQPSTPKRFTIAYVPG